MKKLFTFLYLIMAFSAKADYWTQKADFAGIGRSGSYSFVIGSKGYIGAGQNCITNVYFNDLWEYDPSANSWTQKASFGGSARIAATGFSLLNKGYAGLGLYGLTCFQDFWEYDPLLNSWVQVANFPGAARSFAASFVIGNLAYVGSGFGSICQCSYSDIYAYDPPTNSWQQKASLNLSRYSAASFSIGNKGYLGTGINQSNYLNDFLEYDPVANLWTVKTNIYYPCSNTSYFSIGLNAYIGLGISIGGNPLSFRQWNQTSNLWSLKTSFAGPSRTHAVSFAIGNKGYTGLGSPGSGISYIDFWEYTPDSTTGIEENANDNFQFTISPNPAHQYAVISWQAENKKAELLITTLEGKKVYETKLFAKANPSFGGLTSGFRLPTSDFPKGIYLVQIISNQKISATQKLVVE